MSTTPAAPNTHVTHRPREAEVSSVTWCGHTKLIFLWPIIALGYVFWPLESMMKSIDHEVLGWIYSLTMATVVLAVSVDLNRNFGFVWLLVIALIITLGRLAEVKGIPILTNIVQWFRNLNVEYNRAFGLALSVLLTIFFVIGLLWAWMNNRYTMTHNEIVHHVWGRGDRSVGRGARVITMNYPDWFEFILAMAGTIIVYDNTGRNEICRSEHVPLLPMRAKKIQKLLETLEVTEDNATAAAADPTDPDATDDLH